MSERCKIKGCPAAGVYPSGLCADHEHPIRGTGWEAERLTYDGPCPKCGDRNRHEGAPITSVECTVSLLPAPAKHIGRWLPEETRALVELANALGVQLNSAESNAVALRACTTRARQLDEALGEVKRSPAAEVCTCTLVYGGAPTRPVGHARNPTCQIHGSTEVAWDRGRL